MMKRKGKWSTEMDIKWGYVFSVSREKCKLFKKLRKYRIVTNNSPSFFEAHVDLFRLLMKGIFDPYVL